MGLYVGGTAAANELDDYEEGTWTPSFQGATQPSWHTKVGTYVKVGQVVTLNMWLQASSTTSNTDSIRIDIPFACSNVNGSRPLTSPVRCYSLRNWGSQRSAFGFTTSGSSYLDMMWVGSGSNPANMNMNLWQNGAEIHFSMTYRTQ